MRCHHHYHCHHDHTDYQDYDHDDLYRLVEGLVQIELESVLRVTSVINDGGHLCLLFSSSVFNSFCSDSWFFFHLLAICWNSPLTRSARIWTKELLKWYLGKHRYTSRKIQMQKKGNTNSKTGKYLYTYTQIRTQKNIDTQTEKHKHSKTKSARIWTKALDCKCFGWPCMRAIRTIRTIYWASDQC